jgi:hypothetical protein
MKVGLDWVVIAFLVGMFLGAILFYLDLPAPIKRTINKYYDP